MAETTHGIHHITAIAGDPQQNIDFYAGILGLRLVKKTVNFDDPHTYHFYYGDAAGHPGTILTFFPWGARRRRGSGGIGQATTIAFSIPAGAVGYWTERLEQNQIHFNPPFARFDEEVITFHDPDGLELELVGSAADTRSGWDRGSVAADGAIRGFHSVALSVQDYEPSAALMTETLGFRKVREEGNRIRCEAGAGGPGNTADILSRPDSASGRMGTGTNHHVAWRIADDASQLELREELAQLSYDVSEVMDRQYFRSIYFREPGNVLFEVATDPPEFTADEDLDQLGADLKLPPWLEGERAAIEKALPSIVMPGDNSAR